jgi:hypothetical protein
MPNETSDNSGQSRTAALTEAPPTPAWPDPEFVDCKGLEAGWGIKRSLAYALLAEGKIQGVSLRRRNQVRGKRLFKVDSVRAFLNSQMESTKPACS